jgi:hypothetical protein
LRAAVSLSIADRGAFVARRGTRAALLVSGLLDGLLKPEPLRGRQLPSMGGGQGSAMSRSLVRVAAAAVFVLTACGTGSASRLLSGATAAAPRSSATVTASATTSTSRRAFAYYYLWWTSSHWHTKLGSAFPYAQSPWPLPARLGANGCPPVSLYSGNQLTDTPAASFTQDDPSVIARDVSQAAVAGLSGFIVNWKGTGLAGQTTADSSTSQRLAALVAAVHDVNDHGVNFKLWISLQASASAMSNSAIANDLAYLQRTYAGDTAFDHAYGSRIVLLWTGSRKYSLDTVRAISSAYRSSFMILGDESGKTWPDGRAAYLDGDAYYWSAQDPYNNPASFTQLQSLATTVRQSGSGKLFIAPFTPGYDSILNGGSTCIPRGANGDTMRLLFAGNSATNPDAWALISWNEISEGSYVMPLQRYGTSTLQTLRSLVAPS